MGYDPIRTATNAACLHLWQGVVLQVLTDVEVGLRILRAGPVSSPDRASKRGLRLREARAAAAWLFGSVARGDRDWICGWLDLEPRRLQAAVRRQHGAARTGSQPSRPKPSRPKGCRPVAPLHRPTLSRLGIPIRDSCLVRDFAYRLGWLANSSTLAGVGLEPDETAWSRAATSNARRRERTRGK